MGQTFASAQKAGVPPTMVATTVMARISAGVALDRMRWTGLGPIIG